VNPSGRPGTKHDAPSTRPRPCSPPGRTPVRIVPAVFAFPSLEPTLTNGVRWRVGDTWCS
jgi:hypothetical protein